MSDGFTTALALRKRGKSMAQGGAASEEDREADMIARIMRKRSELSNPPALEAEPLEELPEEPEDDIARIMSKRKG